MKLPEEYVYQRYIRKKICERLHTAVIGVMGCGKTRPVVDACVELGVVTLPIDITETKFPKGPILILCSGPAVAVWLKQFPQWADDPSLIDDMYVVSRLSKVARMALWRHAIRESGIYITNSGSFVRDFEMIRNIPWSTVIADEYHKYMRNVGQGKNKNKTYKGFKTLTRHLYLVILVTGSAVSKNAASLFTAFQLSDHKVFTSYWRFVNTFCFVSESEFGTEVYGTKSIKALHTIMDRYFAYVPEEVVADNLPKGKRQLASAIMTPSQEKVYNDIADSMIAVVNGVNVIVAPTILSKLIKLRQLLCCPKILDPSLDMGGGFEVVLEALQLNPHVVIFVPFRPACIYVRDALREEGYDVNMIRGGISTQEQVAKTTYFRNSRSTLICTIAYSESFDLETCKTSYFMGYEYSMTQNEQAEGRTRRCISKHKFVTWNYIQYLRTIDEEMLANLEHNMINAKRILKRPQAIIDALKGIQP